MDKEMAIILSIFAIAFLTYALYLYLNTPQGSSWVVTSRNVYVQDLKSLALLGDFNFYVVSYIRQSGNEYSSDKTFSSKDDVIKSISQTIRKTNMEPLNICGNSEAVLEVWRGVYNAAGKNRSKKLGMIIVRAYKDKALDFVGQEEAEILANAIVYGEKMIEKIKEINAEAEAAVGLNRVELHEQLLAAMDELILFTKKHPRLSLPNIESMRDRLIEEIKNSSEAYDGGSGL